MGSISLNRADNVIHRIGDSIGILFLNLRVKRFRNAITGGASHCRHPRTLHEGSIRPQCHGEFHGLTSAPFRNSHDTLQPRHFNSTRYADLRRPSLRFRASKPCTNLSTELVKLIHDQAFLKDMLYTITATVLPPNRRARQIPHAAAATEGEPPPPPPACARGIRAPARPGAQGVGARGHGSGTPS